MLLFVNCEKDRTLNHESLGITKPKKITVDDFILTVKKEFPKIDQTLPLHDSKSLDLKQKEYIDEAESNESFNLHLENSKLLLSSLNFTEGEILDEFSDLNDPKIIASALLITYIDKKNAKKSKINFVNIAPDPLDCFGVASGVAGIYDLLQNTKSLAQFGESSTRKQLLKLIGKLGRRFLGWIGVAILIKDWGNCMEYW